MPLPKNLTVTKSCTFAQKGMTQIFGNFTFNGTGAPDAAEGKPFRTSGLDLSRQDTGDYTLTVPGTGSIDILYLNFVLVDGTDLLAPVQDITISESARTIAFTIYDAETVATPTDPTDGAKLHVHLVLKTTEDV